MAGNVDAVRGYDNVPVTFLDKAMNTTECTVVPTVVILIRNHVNQVLYADYIPLIMNNNNNNIIRTRRTWANQKKSNK